MSNISVPTFEQLVKTELAKYDAVIPKVEELKEQFLSLKIASIEDGENYQKVKDAIKFVVSKRVEIEEKRKELKADSIAYGKAVDARAREITSMITPIEEYLKDEKARIDFEIEQIKAREEEARQQKIKQRHETLLQAGMNRIGNEYIWTSPNNPLLTESFAAVNLETLGDEQFDEYVSSFRERAKTEQDAYDREQLRKAEKELLLEMEREKLAQEQRKLMEEQEKMRQEQENMRKEMEELKNARTNARLIQLSELGLIPVPHLNAIGYRKGSDYIALVGIQEVRDAMADEWQNLYSMLQNKSNSLKAEDEKKRAEEIERLKKEAIEAEEQRKKQAQEQEAKIEQERLAGLSDKDKMIDYCQKLLEIPTPELKTLKWKKELKVIHTTIVAYLQ